MGRRKKERATPSTRTAGGVSEKWDLVNIRRRLDAQFICRTWMKREDLEPGSDMRRRGEKGVRSWMSDLGGIGIESQEFALYVYMDEEKSEDKLLTFVEKYKEKFAAAGISVPATIEFAKEDTADLKLQGRLIDGGHRHESCRRLAKEAKSAAARAPYEWIPVRIYKRAVLPDICLFSKIINDQGSTGVKEDALEVLTFYQGMTKTFVETEQLDLANEMAQQAYNKSKRKNKTLTEKKGLQIISIIMI